MDIPDGAILHILVVIGDKIGKVTPFTAQYGNSWENTRQLDFVCFPDAVHDQYVLVLECLPNDAIEAIDYRRPIAVYMNGVCYECDESHSEPLGDNVLDEDDNQV